MPTKPDLKAKIQAALDARAKRAPKCGVCHLPPEALAAVREARAGVDPAPYTLLARVLQDEGHAVAGTAISNHFRIHEPAK